MFHAAMIDISPRPALSAVNRPRFFSQALFSALAREDLPDWADAQKAIRIRRFPEAAMLFADGDAHPYIHVIAEGLVKNVYLDAEGNEWIKSFISPGGFAASIAALEEGGTASFSAIAVTPTITECLPYVLLDTLAARHLAWANALRRGLVAFARRKEKREHDLLTLKPEARYRALMRDEPGLDQKIPQKDLARYLGLTPVGLNRIIRRVRDAG